MKKARDTSGRFIQNRILYRWFISGALVLFLITLSFVGIRQIFEALVHFAGSLETHIEVINASAEEITPTPVPGTPEDIHTKILRYADKYSVSFYQMERTIWCETKFRNVQSSIVHNGLREDSWGIAQIHLPSHPEVTRAQALDVDFSLNFMARHFSMGKDWMWHGYNKSKDKCN